VSEDGLARVLLDLRRIGGDPTVGLGVGCDGIAVIGVGAGCVRAGVGFGGVGFGIGGLFAGSGVGSLGVGSGVKDAWGSWSAGALRRRQDTHSHQEFHASKGEMA